LEASRCFRSLRKGESPPIHITPLFKFTLEHSRDLIISPQSENFSTPNRKINQSANLFNLFNLHTILPHQSAIPANRFSPLPQKSIP
jgi:hypothetical protein